MFLHGSRLIQEKEKFLKLNKRVMLEVRFQVISLRCTLVLPHRYFQCVMSETNALHEGVLNLQIGLTLA